MNTNYVTIEARLTRDPELRQAGKGNVCSFSVAHSTRRMVDGQWIDGDPGYYDVTAWNKLGETAMQLKKGDPVIVIGKLSFEKWEKDGQKRSAVRVVASAIGKQLIPEKNQGQNESDIPF